MLRAVHVVAVGWAGLPAAYPPEFRSLIAQMVHPNPDARPTIADAAAALLQLKQDAWGVGR